ncbi:hypothetical protein FOCC_FOCC010774 [Frankliniella occidentalis]|nr:hypothetical protein FOCC_FOCC010774 [Frankliniella occidentalis]
MESRTAVLMLALLHAAGLSAALPTVGVDHIQQRADCKDICEGISGLDTFFDGECFCVLDHAPTPFEMPQVERAIELGKDCGVDVITSVVGYDKTSNREERCMMGVTSELRARAARGERERREGGRGWG